MSIDRMVEALRRGDFVLIHDASDREDEIDLAILAEAVEPRHIVTMRRDAGGLICVALHSIIADNFGLPYMTEIYGAASSRYKVLEMTKPDDIPYDERSAFSISVNHRRTFTGITDFDRALTIRELGRFGTKGLDAPIVEEFGQNFRSPGHVPLLRAVNDLLLNRRGHTELAVALAEMAGLTPAVAICEMLDAGTNRALSWKEAVEYADRWGLPYLSGAEIVDAYADWRKER